MVEILIVCDFTDMFLDEVSGLPLARVVEFIIDFVLNTTPIFRAPYCMAPLKLRDQLQVLLNWLLDQASDPWGSPVLFVKKKDGRQ